MICQRHSRGVGPNTPDFFVKNCEMCERKKVAGLVKGDETQKTPNNAARAKAMGIAFHFMRREA
jgi:hypothetical protein